jgi:acyl carrier protein
MHDSWSLGHGMLAYSLEHEFNIRFEIDELPALQNVREILRVVSGKLGAAS